MDPRGAVKRRRISKVYGLVIIPLSAGRLSAYEIGKCREVIVCLGIGDKWSNILDYRRPALHLLGPNLVCFPHFSRGLWMLPDDDTPLSLTTASSLCL
jgi:hypothetical protein